MIVLTYSCGVLDIKPSVYYLTLKVDNRVGKKLVIAPSGMDLNEGFHVGTGSIMQITKELSSSEPLTLRAFDPETKESFLINNKQSLTVSPSQDLNEVKDITLTIPGKLYI